MKHLFNKVFMLFLLLGLSLNASTMYLLTKIPKAYLVVENYSKTIPNEIRYDILYELENTTKELNIDTSGYSQRTLAFIITDSYLGDIKILNIELIVGEQVRRIDDNEEVFALTYQNKKQVLAANVDEDELYDTVIDKVDELLISFKQQYIEDNE